MTPLLAETSDLVQICQILTPVALAIIALFQYRAKLAADAAAKNVKEVKDDLAANKDEAADERKGLAEMIEANTKVTEATHDLVNGGLKPLLESNAEGAEFKAMSTGDKGDIAVAKSARVAYDNHVETEARQQYNRPQPENLA